MFVEGLTGGLFLEDDAVIARYREALQIIRDVALTEDATSCLVWEIAEDCHAAEARGREREQRKRLHEQPWVRTRVERDRPDRHIQARVLVVVPGISRPGAFHRGERT